MRIGFASTYPPMRCAIGLYTQNLAKALLGVDPDAVVRVAAELGSEREEAAGGRLLAEPCYGRDGEYEEALFRFAKAHRCDVMHFQYAPDLFGQDERLPRLLARLRAEGVRTFVTLHTVYARTLKRTLLGRPDAKRLHRNIARHADGIVVHHDEGSATVLRSQGIDPGRISVIPHGTVRSSLPDRATARQNLDLAEDAFVFTFFGFIHLQKNVHTIVEAFRRVARENPHATLVVSGMPWGDRWYNHLYVGAMKTYAAARQVGPRLQFRDQYLPPHRVPDLYAATDVVLLPHDQTYGSASGVFHQAIGAGKPVICAVGPKFADANRLLADVPELCVPPKSTSAWASAMRRAAEDPELLERCRRAIEDYSVATEWPASARRHRSLYEGALRSVKHAPASQAGVSPA